MSSAFTRPFPLAAALVGMLAVVTTGAHAQDKPPAPGGDTPSKTLTIDPAAIQKPWTGDLDGMIQRRLIRVLTVYSKTFFFVDKGVQRGTVVDGSGCSRPNSTRSWSPKHNSSRST